MIDNKAIVLTIKNKSSTDDCPDVVFEIDDHLGFIQVKTFNDADVDDKFISSTINGAEIMDLLSKWKESKRYLLSHGRTVFRDPDPTENNN